MAGDKSKFSSLTLNENGYVTYGNSNKGKIVGKVGKTPSTSIDNVLYVQGLKHSLLSISQLCDKEYKITFDSNDCIIEGKEDNVIKFIGHRDNNIYMINLDDISSNVQCLITKEEDSWLWHRRIAHIHMDHLNKSLVLTLIILISCSLVFA